MVKVQLPNKKMRTQQKNTTTRKPWKQLTRLSLLVVLSLVMVAGTAYPIVHADTIQEQINALQQQNDSNQSVVTQLQNQAASYQDAIRILNTQISSLQAQINDNIATQTALQAQIVQKQAELDQQKKALGEDIKSIYVNGKMSTVEMLATSQDLSHFIDAETYRGAVQSKIQNTLNEIARIQGQLKSQKDQVEALLQTQQNQQAQITAAQHEQSNLLAMNEGQQSAYNQKTKGNQAKIEELQRKQAALNAQGSSRVSISGDERGGACDVGSGNGGYRLASSAQGDACDAEKDSILDWAGIENRECTSYAYWYFKRVLGNSDFTAQGNAKDWVNTSNYPVHDWPKVGAVGVKTAGTYGHVTIVQAVGPTTWKGVNVPSGQVLTSEMNGDFTGKFGYMLRDIVSMQYLYK